MVVTHRHALSTKGQGDAHDITGAVASALTQSGLRGGTATVFVSGSTAGITTIEFEPGAVHDLNAVFEELAPRAGDYRHHLRWGDDNGSSHVRAALLGSTKANSCLANGSRSRCSNSTRDRDAASW